MLAADPVQLASGVPQWFVSCSVYMGDVTFSAMRGQVAHAPMVPGTRIPPQKPHVKSVVKSTVSGEVGVHRRLRREKVALQVGSERRSEMPQRRRRVDRSQVVEVTNALRKERGWDEALEAFFARVVRDSEPRKQLPRPFLGSSVPAL